MDQYINVTKRERLPRVAGKDLILRHHAIYFSELIQIKLVIQNFLITKKFSTFYKSEIFGVKIKNITPLQWNKLVYITNIGGKIMNVGGY